MNLLIILHPSKNENTTRGFCLIPGDITASGKQRASRGQRFQRAFSLSGEIMELERLRGRHFVGAWGFYEKSL
jgi:hypothetical protein